MLDISVAAFSERVPYRLMDSRWTYGLLDPALLGPPEELLPYSTLAGAPHPLHTMSADDYALTHALFYLSDFGLRPTDAVGEAGALLDPFLAWNAVRGDLDLLGEFLVTARALRTPASPAARFGWEILERAWDEQGGLVGPEYSPRRFAELSGLEAEAYAFSENYHTVFVGGILCAVALEFLLDQQLDDGSVGIHGLLADAGSADAAPAAQATLALLLRQVATALAA